MDLRSDSLAIDDVKQQSQRLEVRRHRWSLLRPACRSVGIGTVTTRRALVLTKPRRSSSTKPRVHSTTSSTSSKQTHHGSQASDCTGTASPAPSPGDADETAHVLEETGAVRLPVCNARYHHVVGGSDTDDCFSTRSQRGAQPRSCSAIIRAPLRYCIRPSAHRCIKESWLQGHALWHLLCAWPPTCSAGTTPPKRGGADLSLRGRAGAAPPRRGRTATDQWPGHGR
jgi:hypothetical protein